MPGNDPITLLLKKQTADGHGSGDTRLEGAEYTVKYYDILSDTDPAIAGNEAKYTWIFKTDEKGRIRLTDDYLVSGSDGLIVNIAGRFTLPLLFRRQKHQKDICLMTLYMLRRQN